MSIDHEVDVAILGAGSGGERLAEQLARRGHAVAVVEERLVGGECPYFACMPSKSMLHDAAAGVPFAEAASRRDQVAEHFDDADHVADLEASGVAVVRGRGAFAGPGRIHVEEPDGATSNVTATHLVLATGAFEAMLPDAIAGDADVWSSEDAWTSHERPDRLLVVGGGPVGTEIATAFALFGSQVVLVDRGPRLLDDEDEEVTDTVTANLAGQGVRVVNAAEVQSLTTTDDAVTIVTLSNGEVVEVDRVAAALGKRRRVHDIGLESLGVDPERLTVGTDGRVAGADNLWAVGDVTGHPAFTHAANALADVVAHNLDLPDARPRRLDLAALPRCVFVEPSMGAVGTTSPDEEHVRVSVGLANVARGFADGTGGRAVLAATRSDRRITGFSGVGPGMEEAVSLAALAIRQGLTVDDLAQHVAPFPTYSEVVPVLAARAVEALAD